MMISHEEKKDDDDVIYQEHHHAKAQASSTDDDASAPREKKNMKHQTKKKKKKSPLLLLLCATGITSCYLWYGTIQEHLFQLDNAKAVDEENDGKKKQSITLFLLATGTFSSSVLALIWIMIGPIILSSSSSQANNKQEREAADSSSVGRLNHPLLAITSVTYLSAMAASNESLHYVSYPTCVLAKSSKLIPTMVVGWLVDKYRSWKVVGTSNHSSSSSSICNNGSHNNKGINGMEWLGAAFITIGILAFQYIQLQKQSNGDKSNHGEDEEVVKGDSPYGLALLGMSLFMDGLLGACQSTLKRKHLNNYFRPPSAMETMLFINLYATLILIPCSYYAGQFTHGMSMLFPSSSNNNNLNSVEEVDNTSKLLLQLNLSASLGQVFIFLTIHQFSPLTCTTITTTRKFVTILLSVYKFGHVLDIWQWSSVGLVFGGLYLEIVAKFMEEKGSEVNEDERGGEKEKGD